jgi:hypothetical protein
MKLFLRFRHADASMEDPGLFSSESIGWRLEHLYPGALRGH